MRTRGAIKNFQPFWSGWRSQLLLWEQQLSEDMMRRKDQRPEGAPSGRVEDYFNPKHEQDNTEVLPIAKFKRAEKPTRFLIDEGRYEAICTDVRDPFWTKHWKKWQVRIEFALCGKTIPPLVQFLNCGKDEEAPMIDGWLLQTLDAVGAESPSELKGRDFYVCVRTVMRDRKGRQLPRHEWYSVVSSSSLILSADDLVDIGSFTRRESA